MNDIKKYAEEHDEINNIDIAKIYPSEFWHDDVAIVASRRALLKMRDVIDEALEQGRAQTELMESDGEGYTLKVVCEHRNWQEWNKLPTHYRDTELTNSKRDEELWDNLLKLLTQE